MEKGHGKIYIKVLDNVLEQCYIINIQKHLNKKGARTMTVKEFLKHVDSDLLVIIYDKDKKEESSRKEDRAGNFLREYHFNNANQVDDFSIYENLLFIYTSRH